MIKHVGRHDNKKVVIAYRQVPDEDHMCLVIYSDALPSRVHDELMSVLESDVGQSSKDLADALFRSTMADGTNCLTTLHKGGWLKKVPCNQVIVTPNAKSSVRLDELNNILNEMEKGEDASKKLADIDKKQTQGIDGGRELGEPAKTTSASVNTNTPDVLSDADIANQRLAQATKMEAEAKSLLAEAKRLKEEANALAPKVTKAKVAKATTSTTTPAKKTNARKPTTTKKATA